MTLNLDDILACIGMWRAKIDGQTFVNGRIVLANQPAIAHLLRPILFGAVVWPEQAAQDRQSIGTAQPHDADTTLPNRSGNCGDCVGVQHRKISSMEYRQPADPAYGRSHTSARPDDSSAAPARSGAHGS